MSIKRTAASKAHQGRIAAMPCICCEQLGRGQDTRTHVHHIRAGQGIAQRAADYLAVPLCHDCHQGDNGIHGSQTYLRMLKMTELDLLALTIAKLTGDE